MCARHQRRSLTLRNEKALASSYSILITLDEDLRAPCDELLRRGGVTRKYFSLRKRHSREFRTSRYDCGWTSWTSVDFFPVSRSNDGESPERLGYVTDGVLVTQIGDGSYNAIMAERDLFLPCLLSDTDVSSSSSARFSTHGNLELRTGAR